MNRLKNTVSALGVHIVDSLATLHQELKPTVCISHVRCHVAYTAQIQFHVETVLRCSHFGFEYLKDAAHIVVMDNAYKDLMLRMVEEWCVYVANVVHPSLRRSPWNKLARLMQPSVKPN